MRGKLAKKVHKYSRRQFLEYMEMVNDWPFKARLRLAWSIVVGKA